MARLYIGKRTLQGSLEGYARRFDLLEVRPSSSERLKASTWKRWRSCVPSTFAFSVVLPPEVAELRSDERSQQALDKALEVARLLQSPVIVIATPVSVTPTAANRKRLQELVQRIPRDVVRVAWEPAGVWEIEDVDALAASLQISVVRDAAWDPLPRGPVAYTRLRGLGDGRRLSATRLQRVMDSLRDRKEAYVVVETDQLQKVVRSLREQFDEVQAPKVRNARPRVLPTLMATEDEEQE